jgi:hypothetical protein
MEILADSTVTAIINVPDSKINITEWLFTLKDEEYQACSVDHIAGGNTISKDGARISLNVEQVAGNLLVQHYREMINEKLHCLVSSISDSFSAMGRTKLEITWELRVKAISAESCELSNHVIVKPTDDFLALLDNLNITDLAPIKLTMSDNLRRHNEDETPLFVKDIERKALAGIWD